MCFQNKKIITFTLATLTLTVVMGCGTTPSVNEAIRHAVCEAFTDCDDSLNTLTLNEIESLDIALLTDQVSSVLVSKAPSLKIMGDDIERIKVVLNAVSEIVRDQFVGGVFDETIRDWFFLRSKIDTYKRIGPWKWTRFTVLVAHVKQSEGFLQLYISTRMLAKEPLSDHYRVVTDDANNNKQVSKLLLLVQAKLEEQ